MKAIKAITLSLGKLQPPVVTKYQFGLIVDAIYRDKIYAGESVNLQKDFAERGDVTKYLNLLLKEGVLSPHGTLSNVYTLLGRTVTDPGEVACTVDPFCYMSHLSAMSYHGLTDRVPAKLFISSPAPSQWRSYASSQMKKDLKEGYDDYLLNGMPTLVKTKMSKIGRTEIHSFSSKHLGAYRTVKGKQLRVSTIGRSFLEMIRNPELCGGINHVLDVYEESGLKYLRLITDEVNLNGKPIDKVRAGYILDEIMGIHNETVESWTSYAQRGGSRKLDASSEYTPEWSDKWLISTNIFR